MRTLRSRFLILGSAAALLLSACGADPAATDPATPDPATPAVTDGTGGSPAASGSPSPEQAIADLRSRLEGQTVRIGSSASSNPAITGAVHTSRLLEEMFGVEVDFRQLDSDPLVAAVISGSVDVGQLSLAGTAAGRARGAEFIAFAGDDQPNPYYVVGRAADGIETLEDVRGKRFAATENLSQITGQTATGCLASVGIDITEDVELLQLGNTGSIAEALRSGQVVAGLTAPHRMAPIIAEEGEDAYNVLCLGAEVAPQLNNVWMSRESWLEENEDMALAFAIASVMTGRWAHSEREEWIELALEVAPDYERAAVESIYETYVTDMNLWPENGSLDRELCQATLDSSLESGALDEAMACEDVIRFDFEERALEILGEV